MINIKDITHFYQDSFFHQVLQKELSDCKSVLDVGCGDNSPLGKIHKNFYSEGIDVFKRNIIRSRERKIHDNYKCEDINKLSKLYKKKSFDAVVSLDVIEHLKKSEAIRLISQMENIAKKKVMILTPNGFFVQDEVNGNKYQEHKSGWSVEELNDLGYRVYGLRGLKFLRGEHANIKYKPYLFWGLCAFLSEIVFYFFPDLSFDLFAVKKL